MPIRGKRGAPALRYFRQLPPRADLNAAICSKCVKKRALSEEGGQNSCAIRGRGSGVRFAITFFLRRDYPLPRPNFPDDPRIWSDLK